MLRFSLILGAIQLGVAMLRKFRHPASPPPLDPGPMTDDELEEFYLAAAAGVPGAPDWRKSIVDRLKILRLDSTKIFRTELWREIGHTDAYEGTAEQNIQLLVDVDKKIADREPITP